VVPTAEATDAWQTVLMAKLPSQRPDQKPSLDNLLGSPGTPDQNPVDACVLADQISQFLKPDFGILVWPFILELGRSPSPWWPQWVSVFVPDGRRIDFWGRRRQSKSLLDDCWQRLAWRRFWGNLGRWAAYVRVSCTYAITNGLIVGLHFLNCSELNHPLTPLLNFHLPAKPHRAVTCQNPPNLACQTRPQRNAPCQASPAHQTKTSRTYLGLPSLPCLTLPPLPCDT
jgi:hypothetical protein